MDHPFSPEEQLRAGAAILGELLEPAGFAFALLTVGNSSGGRFAIGEFIRGNHRLELHYRFGLGIVIYHVCDCSSPHGTDAFTRSLEPAEFPTVLDRSLPGFYVVHSDLRNYGGPFLDPDASQFAILAKWYAKNPMPTGFKALSSQYAVKNRITT